VLERSSREHGVSTHQAVLSLIIVAREQRDLWRSLVDEFQDVEQIQVLLDRRHGERRTPWGPVAYDRRARERRTLPRLEDDLHARQYLLVRPHHRRPHD
jgi:hypothetical protein